MTAVLAFLIACCLISVLISRTVLAIQADLARVQADIDALIVFLTEDEG
jgi:hypothetical protein